MNQGFCIRFVQNNMDAALIRWAIGYLNDALKKDGVDVKIVNVSSPEGRNSCDSTNAVLFYRTYDLDSLDLFKKLKAKGKFLMYFIDDYIFQPGCKYVAPNTDRAITPFLAAADAIVSSNSRLLEKIPKDKKKILRRSAIDRETFDLLNPGQFAKSVPNHYTIGWLAGIGRKERNDFVREMLRLLDGKLTAEDRVVFFCLGSHSLGNFKRIQVTEHPYFEPGQWRELYQTYRSLAFNVVVNPLDEQDEFFHCKSELKYIETGALMVPLVTARVHPFTEVIHEDSNGFLASTPNEFAEKALMVCRNPSLAERVAQAAHDCVGKDYDSVRNARRFLADVLEAMASKSR